MTSAAQPPSSAEGQGRSRSKTLQLLGILSGFTAGAWLGAAEAPTKLVSIGISPMAISLIMVIGVFLALWSLPADTRDLVRSRGRPPCAAFDDLGRSRGLPLGSCQHADHPCHSRYRT